MTLKTEELQMKRRTENGPYLEPIRPQHGVLNEAGDRYLLQVES